MHPNRYRIAMMTQEEVEHYRARIIARIIDNEIEYDGIKGADLGSVARRGECLRDINDLEYILGGINHVLGLPGEFRG